MKQCEKCNKSTDNGKAYSFNVVYKNTEDNLVMQKTEYTSYNRGLSTYMCRQCLSELFSKQKKFIRLCFVTLTVLTPLLLYASMEWSDTIYSFFPIMALLSTFFWIGSLSVLFKKESDSSYEPLVKAFLKGKRFEHPEGVELIDTKQHDAIFLKK